MSDQQSEGDVSGPTAETTTKRKAKNPTKVAAGHAGAAARKVKQKRLLEELQAAKESVPNHPVATIAAAAVPVKDHSRASAETEERTNWTPCLVEAAGLAVAVMFQRLCSNTRPRRSASAQTKRHASVAVALRV